MQVNSAYGKQQMQAGSEKSIILEHIAIRTRREKEGWFIMTGEASELPDLEKQDLSTGEYYQTGKSNSLHFLPALPSKPLVFKGSRLFVVPKQRITFFIKIPLNIEIFYSKVQPENLLKEIVPVRLSDTWFGAADSGEQAYSHNSVFFLQSEQIKTSMLESVCPVSIINQSPGMLEVERLIIRTDNLALYMNNQKLVTSVLEIEYKGKDIVSSAEYHYNKLYHGEFREPFRKPKTTAGLGLLKNFHFIKNIYRSE